MSSRPRNINELILDYLRANNYRKIAAIFAEEARLQQCDFSQFDQILDVRMLIASGSIESAIENITNIDPHFLDENLEMHFNLLFLKLVTRIEKADASDLDASAALLSQARDEILPLIEIQKEREVELEKEYKFKERSRLDERIERFGVRNGMKSQSYLNKLQQLLIFICFPQELAHHESTSRTYRDALAQHVCSELAAHERIPLQSRLSRLLAVNSMVEKALEEPYWIKEVDGEEQSEPFPEDMRKKLQA